MAYKFQHGDAILSGALDQEGSIDIKNDGSGEFELKHDGNTILNSSRALGNVTSISGSTSISGRDLVLDVGGKVGISTDTDLLTLTADTVTVAGAGSFTGPAGTAVALSASARADVKGLRIDTAGVIGTAGDTDLLTLNNAQLLVAGAVQSTTVTATGGAIAASAGAVSGSTGLAGRGVTIDEGGKIGTSADNDLIELNANSVAIAGALSASTRIDGRGLRIDTGGAIGTAGDNDLLTLNNGSLVVAGDLSGSGISGSYFRVDNGGTFGPIDDVDLLTLNDGSLVVAGFISGSEISSSAYRVDNGGTFGPIDDADLLTLNSAQLVVGGALTASTRIDGRGLRIDTGGVIGTAGDNDLLTLNNASLVVAGEVQPLTLSASARIDGFGLRIDTGGTIGTAGDNDLLTLANGVLQIAGEVSSSGDADHLAVNAHSFSINNEDFIDASSNITAAGLSGSGNLLAAGTVRLDGVAAAVIDEDNDFFYILDADDALVKKEAVGDVVTTLAGDGIENSGNKFRLTLNGLAAAVVDVANDSIGIIDANSSNESKKESIVDFVDAIAGGGLTATAGVLSTQAGSVRVIDDGNTLSEGYNYYTGSAAKSVNLPAAPSVGDVVVIKAGNLGAGNALTVSRQGSHTIDGLTSVALESDYAAASFVYLVNNNWGII